MMDEMITDETRLDEAINSYPLTPLPPGFAQRVMVEVSRTPQLEARFRLQFIDLALPAFMTTFGTAVLLTTLWLSGHWTIAGLSQPVMTIPFSNYVEAIPDEWIGIGLMILLLELVASLIVAGQVISDQPQVAIQNSR